MGPRNAYMVRSRFGHQSDRILKTEGNKMDAFMEHFAKEIEEYFRHYGGKYETDSRPKTMNRQTSNTIPTKREPNMKRSK
jgi:hypothetical protein